jgi:hypothetical protein
MATDITFSRHKKIQNMNLMEMADYFSETLELCHKPIKSMPCSICKSCSQCWKEFLQGSDN